MNVVSGSRAASAVWLNVVTTPSGGSSAKIAASTSAASVLVSLRCPRTGSLPGRVFRTWLRPFSVKRMVPLVVTMLACSHIAMTSFSPRLNRPRLVGSLFFALCAKRV